ncbi:MAG: 3-oxoacyl-[acyl-carrier-protein] reductase [Bacteroidia bacterium]|jgi:3-oxoacyl-[acyl-carrier protein] reductase|nr:3-oxoacyl-[acyl-carrier-protein] reductase [Bacteroidia bacterium]MDG1747110.1 3-oxoacyl-[acyl-carrier-protein] reductase [Bacteroidia bacterium]
MLNGKSALITGATRGIGKGIAETFAKNGCNIAFTFASSVEKAKAFEAELTEKYGVKAKGYQSNAADFTQSEELAKNVIADFDRIDILINNAGITRDGLMLRMSEEQWDEVINTNLKSAFNLTKSFLRHFMGNKAGSIINMTSVVGVTGNAGQANYAASKAGMIGFTKSIAKELGSRSIRCNAVAPGFIETEMTEALDAEVRKGWTDTIPLKRGGSPEDVANTCLFLASDMSAYITGQTLSVCGGMLM